MIFSRVVAAANKGGRAFVARRSPLNARIPSVRRGVRHDLTACTHKLPDGVDPTGFGLFARRAIARATVLVDVASNARFVRNGADDPANQPSAEGLEHGHTFQVGKHMFWVKQEQHGERGCVALIVWLANMLKTCPGDTKKHQWTFTLPKSAAAAR